MENILVADIMTRNPIIVKPTINLLECTKEMVKKKVGTLLLVEGKKLVGVISRKDILWVLIKKPQEQLSKINAIDISPKKIATIKPTATIRDALQKMKKLKFRVLPVINNNELVGVITIKDILSFHPELYPELEEIKQISEETNKLKRIKKAKEILTAREGYCEECGNYGLLTKIHGTFICSSCRDSM